MKDYELRYPKNVRVLKSAFEAEDQAASLVRNGMADYVLSDDIDTVSTGVHSYSRLDPETGMVLFMCADKARKETLPRECGIQHEFSYLDFADANTLLSHDFAAHPDGFGKQTALTFIAAYFTSSQEVKEEMLFKHYDGNQMLLNMFHRSRTQQLALLSFVLIPKDPSQKTVWKQGCLLGGIGFL
jgi:hypothetical protein